MVRTKAIGNGLMVEGKGTNPKVILYDGRRQKPKVVIA
jgi:hypothetical protein